jgi:hypothetical protein
MNGAPGLRRLLSWKKSKGKNEGKKQIPFGNDRKKGKGKGMGKGKGKNKGEIRG